ncbi:RagB/SusD family nutrient uptake outer membrane protein [Pedobacter sp. SD-b]|uniref:RagB/SusD family nutrient uptake outer membrane protein n=1 Tax=Pedobacter segetis TaxID=2793069 RepID=A0ABS1BNZ2_9SPHI|nr:RagB/SusD family nutrient uptake outer membrane protein [Pedobacter segetis]MBK0384056.1 RagB/SusD family nutrient uptake outer membrane protein [Pedobacter segetis]
MKLTYILLLAGLFALAGCSDFLDDQIQYVREKDVTSYDQRSRGIINDIYTSYSFDYFRDFSSEYLTDNGVSSSDVSALASGYWGPTSNPFEYVWQQSYNNIRQVYQYIQLVHDKNLPYLENPADSLENARTIARYYGEAFFLKAWAEWRLLQIYGGPSATGEMLGFPIVNGILENDAYAKLPRNTYDECVEQIMSDLDVAITNLPLVYSGAGASNPGYSSAETGRASGLAAYALKAKVALYAASPAFNPTNDLNKWKTAAALVKQVIDKNGGLKNLQPYDYTNENNPDQIWRLRNGRQNNSLEKRLYPPTLYGQGEVNPSENLVEAFPAANGYPISLAQSNYNAATPYNSRDKRFYRFIFYNGDACYDGPTCTSYKPLQIYQGGLDNFGGFIPDEGTRTGYYLKKFLNNLNFDPAAINATTNLPKVYVQLGLADMYLIYAETLNEAYGQPSVVPAGFSFSAKDALAKIRIRAGFTVDPYLTTMASNQSDFRTLVKNERRLELCFSGERFHDLRRWNNITNTENVNGVKIIKNPNNSLTYQNIVVEKRAYEAKNSYLPLPYSELLLNSNLKQNKGW